MKRNAEDMESCDAVLSLPHRQRNHKHNRNRQMYLDFGQASFGSRTICPICNTLVVHGLEEDEQEHEKVCSEYRFGVKFPMRKDVRIVSTFSFGNRSKTKDSIFSKRNNGNETASIFSPIAFARKMKVDAIASTTTDNPNINNNGTNSSMCIVEIRPGDSIYLRRKALAVKSIVDQELGFAPTDTNSTSNPQTSNESMDFSSQEHTYDGGRNNDQGRDGSLGGKTIFLCVQQQDKRVVGFCSVETIPCAYHLLINDHRSHLVNEKRAGSKEDFIESTVIHDVPSVTPEWKHGSKDFHSLGDESMNKIAKTSPNMRQIASTYTRSEKPRKAIMGVHQLWCHRSHRQKSIASRLVDAAREKLVYGMVIPKNWVAFSSPTADGASFATKYVTPGVPLVYECS